MNQEQAVEFVPLLNFENDYEILNIYPFTIRRKRDHYEIKESILNTGDIRIKLNRKTYLKHKLIAKQFIPNPLNLPEVDHINPDRADYHIENLRWVSHSENSKNKSSHCGVEYVYVDVINEDSIVVTDYGNHEFEIYMVYLLNLRNINVTHLNLHYNHMLNLHFFHSHHN